MYICIKCGRTFNEPTTVMEPDGEWGECPYCGSADYESAWPCAGCREEKLYSELVEGLYCAECMEKATKDPTLVNEFLREPDVRGVFAEVMGEKGWKPKGDLHEKV